MHMRTCLMEPLCEYCGAQRALVYCKPDAARLCLPCDLHVHSANSLSRRHLRALICDRCVSQPAAVRLADDKLSLCHACAQWTPAGPAGQGRHAIGFYSGWPSLPELSRILAAANDGGGRAGPGAGAGPGTMSTINENCESTCWDSAVLPELDPWMATAAAGPGSCLVPSGVGEQQKDSNFSTLAYPSFEDIGLCDDDDGICEGFNPGDVGFNLDNIDELFGCTQTKYPFPDGGLSGVLMDKNISVADSNGHIENAVEASSSIQHDGMTLPSTHIDGSASSALHAITNPDQMLLHLPSNRNINLGFPSGNVCQNMSLSLSNMTGESSVADYQDCGVSPMFLSGESPWDSNIETSHPQAARKEAKMRYNEKKKKSKLFGKQIRYASRKARADTRKRVKGRFVKAGEAYDYDPLVARSS